MKSECTDCHERVETSKVATDLSLPGILECTPCHRSSAEYEAGGIDNCQTCHYYHELSLAYGEGWTLETAEIPEEMKLAAQGELGGRRSRPKLFGLPFWAAISLPLALVVLVGVAGVFVGAARSSARRPRIPRLPVPEPDRREEPRESTPPRPQPVEASPPEVEKPERASQLPDRTVAMDLSELTEEPVVSPGRTIATEYFGSIVFTAGPLEGRRFTIDPEAGNYIGRDKGLANIVIEDGRISRRHAWVGVRGDVVVVVDHNSTNGTYLEKDPSARVSEARLEHGDVVILGERAAVFRFDP